MFQFRRFPTYAYFIQRRLIRYCRTGFPHSEISGSKPICGSPKLIAACHVLHRLLMPRHSPCALISLTSFLTALSHRSEYGSLESCRPQSFEVFYHITACCCFTHYTRTASAVLIKVPQLTCYSLLLAFNIWNYHIVQFSRCSFQPVKVRFQYPIPWILKSNLTGGPKWTRTTDLTIISRVL